MLGIELQQTRVYQEAKAEGETIGEARGLERGRTEEGRALVLKQLARKLGKIEPEIRSRGSSLSLDRIESLGQALLDFTQIADLTRSFIRLGSIDSIVYTRSRYQAEVVAPKKFFSGHLPP